MYPGYDVLGGLREALLFLIFSRTTWGPRFRPRLLSVLRGSQPEAQVEERGSVPSQSRRPHPQASWSVPLCKPLQTRTPSGSGPSGHTVGNGIHLWPTQLRRSQAVPDVSLRSAKPHNRRAAGTGQSGTGFHCSDISYKDRMQRA